MPYKTYTIAVANHETDKVQVQGRKVKIVGCEDFEFFVHRSFSANPNIPEQFRGWTVSEASTGWGITNDLYQQTAIAKARDLMASVTTEKFKAMVEQAKKQTGEIAV